MFQTEIFALCGSRSRLVFEAFSARYLKGLNSHQVEFCYPEFADEPTKTLDSLDELVTFLLDTKDASYSLYWGGRNEEHATLHFLQDGGLIANVARYELDEKEQRSMLAELVQVVDAVAGYADIEGLPPLSSEEFIDCSTRAIVGYRKR